MDQGALNFSAPVGGSAPRLRPYQLEALDKLDAAIASGVRAPLLVAPTGAGKTVLGAEIIRRRPDTTTVFLAPRRELIHQTCRKLDDVGVQYGVLLAGDKRSNQYARVQVASVDTLISRMVRSSKVTLLNVGQVIMDEAHVGLTERRQQLLANFPGAILIGLTATPCRADGKAMGSMYDELIEVSNTAELTHDGYLCKARYFSVSEPDLKRVRTTAGDYNRGDLESVMNRPQLVGDIVEHWLKHAPTRRTVVFATTIAHSVALAQQFINSGVSAEHVDANTDATDREAIFRRFSSGQTQVLTNCTLASIGFDLPELDCVVFARPTKSLGLYLQMLGRGLRTAPGKSDCLVLDHAGNVHRHGFATDERYWTLHGRYASDGEKVAREKAERLAKDVLDLQCPECKALWRGVPKCPECGWSPPPKAKPMETRDGSLVELTGFRIGKKKTAAALSDKASPGEQIQFYLELMGHSEAKGYKRGFAAMKYQERFGVFPPHAWRDMEGRDPSSATLRWLEASKRKWIREQQQARREQERRDDQPIIA